jgi:hypothetical protein
MLLFAILGYQGVKLGPIIWTIWFLMPNIRVRLQNKNKKLFKTILIINIQYAPAKGTAKRHSTATLVPALY